MNHNFGVTCLLVFCAPCVLWQRQQQQSEAVAHNNEMGAQFTGASSSSINIMYDDGVYCGSERIKTHEINNMTLVN